MTTIEDSFHQLFTQLIHASRQGAIIEYEGQKFPVGTGPKFTSTEGEVFYDLTGDCGILGHGHPVSFKANLKNVLNNASPQDFSGQIKEINSYLSQLASLDCFIGDYNPELESIYVGRDSSFIDIELLSEVGSINALGLFKNPVSINLTPCTFTLSTSEILDTLKFLSMGQFFGSTGLINNRENQLKKIFKDNPKISGIEGLLVHLKDEEIPDNILIRKNTKFLCFPMTFDETILKEIDSLLR